MTRALPYSVLLCSVVFACCNESLPVREETIGLMTTSVAAGFHREPSGQHYLRFYVTVVNRSDETIEERANFNGTMEITWLPSTDAESPGVNTKRTIAFGAGNIFRAPGYNSGTGHLRMAPGDSVMLYVSWNMRTNDSSFLPSFWGTSTDGQCQVLYSNGFAGSRRISKRQRFSVAASLRLFDRLAMLHVAPASVSSCYAGAYIMELNPPQSPCTNINIVDPCIIIGE